MSRGKQIVLTAPFTEMIDHAGYFIQMGMASIPIWMEWVMDKKYPEWRNVKRFEDGSALAAPAGLRVLERVIAGEFGPDNVVVCYPDDIDQFIGPETKVVALSTHNPLGVTFAAGVYTSIFGSSREPINSHYARQLFDRVKASPHRETFRVLLGGSGSWQITQTKSHAQLGIDCVIDGRSESAEAIKLFHDAIDGEPLPQQVAVAHLTDRNAVIFPDKPTTFGVVEMTTGCGRRCQFCAPDLNPQIDLPKDGIMEAVHANVANGNKQISLATEDMFIWGQVQTDTPFFFPNREALTDLYQDIVDTPGVEQHVLSHSTMAPAVVDPVLIKQLTDILLPKSPIHLTRLSSHPEGKAIVPLIGLETGSVRMAKRIMPSKGVPFHIEDWQSVMIRGLEILNQNNLVSDVDPDGRQPRRDRRGRQGDARSGLRNGATGVVRIPRALRVHAPRGHAHGARHRGYRNEEADPAAVAAHSAVLEDEHAARPLQLVGTAVIQDRRRGNLGDTLAQDQRTELHLADDDVL